MTRHLFTFSLLLYSNKVLFEAVSPAARPFIPLSGSILEANLNPLVFRVLQFNVLADGVSGLRSDLGKFSRANESILKWDNRKYHLLDEIKNIDPDVITLQECDHYYDFFLPELNKMGYSGYFSPKPTSACFEVSPIADGLALFVRRSKMKVISCESKALALSIAGFNEGELQEDENNIKAQNQIGLIAVCEFTSWNQSYQATRETSSALTQEVAVEPTPTSRPPPLIICTTHLKSSKTFTGEMYRQQGILQILERMDNLFVSFSASGRKPAILLTGDFNAVPTSAKYAPPLTYRAVKNHRLSMRSVYNDDIEMGSGQLSGDELYTTWKARRSKLNPALEVINKRCIDYIFYCPYVKRDGIKFLKSSRSAATNNDMARKPVAVADTPRQVLRNICMCLNVSSLVFSCLYLSLLVC